MAEEQQEVASNASANGQAASPEDSEAKALKKKRLMIMIGAAILAVIILGIVILSLVLTLGKASCKSVEDEPFAHEARTKAIHSQDDRALVRFAGYLKLSIEHPGDFDDTRYVEMKLQKVHHSKRSNDIRVNLITDCGTIDLRVFRDEDNTRYALHDIYVKPELSDYPFKVCSAEVDDIYFGFAHYYTCHSSRSYPCIISSDESSQQQLAGSRRKLKRVSLQLDVLDLEIGGDPGAIESGYFDFEPKSC